ncbi:hypothetical protein TNCT_513041 [Trichonephila clavata]|uniref:Uncharacterized protein n=1 Tax=Trichonephila clavata TaxID=2740835 RepID=A0A8X6KSG2_TRICU|nr:hypothetical protein TNCT_513041 [Trichonephila clavata]
MERGLKKLFPFQKCVKCKFSTCDYNGVKFNHSALQVLETKKNDRCGKQVVVQKGRNLINFSSSEGSDLSLHINPKVKEGLFEIEMKNDKTKEWSKEQKVK